MRTRLTSNRQVADEALYRATNATGGGVIPFPPITASQTVYVNKAGSDVTGTGTILQPYLTISHALSRITDASSTKLYAIYVGPGTYVEDVNIKGSISIVGTATEATIIQAVTHFSLGTFVDGDNSGFYGVVLLGDATYNWAGILGSIIYVNAICDGNYVVSNGNAIAFLFSVVDGSLHVTDLVETITTQACQFVGNCTLTSQTMLNSWESFNDSFVGGSVIVDGSHGFSADFTPTNGQVENLTLNGAGATCAVRCDALPHTITLLGGASSPTLESFAVWVAYAPAVPGNWAGSPPTTVQQALDRIAANTTNAHPIP